MTISDLSKWNVHGRVHTLRTEFALWDAEQQTWQPMRHAQLATLRSDGKIIATEAHNPNGSIARSEFMYDEVSRLISSCSWRNDNPPTGRTEYFYDDADRHLRTAFIDPQGHSSDLEISTFV